MAQYKDPRLVYEQSHGAESYTDPSSFASNPFLTLEQKNAKQVVSTPLILLHMHTPLLTQTRNNNSKHSKRQSSHIPH